jgi:hypothetical protein
MLKCFGLECECECECSSSFYSAPDFYGISKEDTENNDSHTALKLTSLIEQCCNITQVQHGKLESTFNLNNEASSPLFFSSWKREAALAVDAKLLSKKS